MISNLQKAARDRETVMIGGGEFGPDEFRLAAHMLDCYSDLLEALERLYNTGHDSTTWDYAMSKAHAAMRKAHQHPARGFV